VKIKTILNGCVLGVAISISIATVTANAQTVNPLDQFRTNAAPQQGQQAQQVPTRPTANVIGSNRTLPAPTIGGTQQGLSQDQINQALQGYNFDGGMSTEERQAEVEAAARDAAFQATLNGAFPLKPEEIFELLDRYRDVREASESRIGGAPSPEITMETVSLDPGSKPPMIKLSPGHVTTLNILDMTGQPWPIQDLSWGGNFEVIQPNEGENIVRISPMKAHEVGNLSIRLLELQTPVIFSLSTNLDTVQYRFDAQIPEYGPYAETPMIDNGPSVTGAQAGGGDMIRVLEGTPPAGASKLNVDGVDGRTTAYDVAGQIYVRTPHTLLSPGWSNSIKSADGTTVYIINKSPVLLLSDRGKMTRAMIEFN
jgi:intracellular multiplication protein IcmK